MSGHLAHPLHETLLEQVKRNSEGIVGFEVDAQPLTAGALLERATTLSRQLPDDARRVALHAPASLQTLTAVHAIWKSGATPVMVSTSYSDNDLRRRAHIAGCSAIVRFDRDDVADVEALPRESPVEVTDDEGFVLFTSGTTGEPKGVILPASGFRARFPVPGPVALPTEGRSATIAYHSTSHAGFALSMTVNLASGVPIVVPGRFTVEGFVQLCNYFTVRVARLTPTMIYDLAWAAGEFRLGELQVVGCGTAEITESTRSEFTKRFGIPIIHSYAATETMGVASESIDDVRAGLRRPHSSGRLRPEIEARVVDSSGADVEVGTPGQLVLRSPTLFNGYLSAAGLERPVADGWFTTRDIVRIDADQYVYVVGRLDDVVVCGGFNIYPSRIESAIASIDGIRDVMVVGIPDERLGQIPVAGVVTMIGSSLDESQLRLLLKETLPAYEVPRRVEFFDALPQHESGKSDRKGLAVLMTERLSRSGA